MRKVKPQLSSDNFTVRTMTLKELFNPEPACNVAGRNRKYHDDDLCEFHYWFYDGLSAATEEAVKNNMSREEYLKECEEMFDFWMIEEGPPTPAKRRKRPRLSD